MQAARAIRKANPTPGDVHVNTPLTEISVAFSNSADSFVAGKMFPTVPVLKQSDLYFRFERENWMVGGAQKRGPSAQSAGGDYTLVTDDYRCDVWALHKDVADQTRANSDAPLRPDINATEWVTENMLITREQEFAQDYFVTGVWGTEQDGVMSPASPPDFQFWDEPGSTPITDLRAAIVSMKGATGKKPNKLLLSMEVWSVLMDHQDFLDRISGGATPAMPALVMRALLAAILEIDEVLIAEAVVNSANEGATEDTGFILGKNALLVHAAPSPGLEIPSAGYTFEWTGLLGAGASNTRISRFRRAEEFKSDRIEGESAYVHKLVAAELGHFFNGAITP